MFSRVEPKVPGNNDYRVRAYLKGSVDYYYSKDCAALNAAFVNNDIYSGWDIDEYVVGIGWVVCDGESIDGHCVEIGDFDACFPNDDYSDSDAGPDYDVNDECVAVARRSLLK